MPMSAVSSAPSAASAPAPAGCCPQHRLNGCLGARRRVRGCDDRGSPRCFRGHFIARGGAGIRSAGSPRQSDRRRLQGPQRHDFKD